MNQRFAEMRRECEVINSADRRLAAHYAVTRVLAESTTLSDATSRILQLICETLGWDVGEMWRINPARHHELYCQMYWHSTNLNIDEFIECTRNPAFGSEGGLPGRVWSAARPVWIEDSASDLEYPHGAMAASAGIHAAIGFPIQLGRQVLGVVGFFSREVQRPDDYLLQMMETIGSQIGQFIERMRAEDERTALLAAEQQARLAAEAKQRHAVFLAEASAMLASSLDYKTTLGRVARLAVPEFAAWCLVDVIEEDRRIHRVATAHPDPEMLARARQIDGSQTDGNFVRFGIERVLLTGCSTWVRHITDSMLQSIARDEVHLEMLRDARLGSCIIAPMLARGRTLGAVTFATSKLGRSFNREDLAFAKEVARRAAVAIDNARLYQEAQAARESAELANRLKDEFLANLSHELRTPLTPILGWVGMLRAGKLDSEVSMHGLHVIERNIKTQTRLIEDLLDVSRIITGKFRLNVHTTNMVPLVQQAVDSVKPAADAKNIRLNMVLDSGEANVAADPDRLQQVMWNLLSNAIKFTPPEGEVRISLQVLETHLRLNVSDNGEGIEAEFLPFVFERFRQADSTATRRYGGLGLGLSIVRHIVELHGGTVAAESPGLGLGTTMSVTFPLAQNVPAVYLPTELTTRSEERRLDGIHVLVVDDEGDTLDWIAVALKQYGAMVSLARNAADAADIITAKKPDVMIADVGLPGEDGFSLISRIRAKGSNTNLPAIALTAYAQHEDKRRALAAGFHIHLSKPIEPGELANAVASMVQKEAARSNQRLLAPVELPHTI